MTELLKCIYKKSLSLTGKLVLYASYIVLAITGIAGIGYVGYYGLLPALAPIFVTIMAMPDSVWSFAISLPWWVYPVIIVPTTIVIYSTFWCIARALTDEDWSSMSANNSALALALTLATLALPLALATLALTLALDPVDKITIWYYIFRFPGAILHYRKRTRSE